MPTDSQRAEVLKMRLPDIRDGFLWLTQGKTRKKLRMAIAGKLAVLIERIQKSHVHGDKLGADP